MGVIDAGEETTQLMRVPFDQGEDGRREDGERIVERALPQFATAVRGYDRAKVDDYMLHFLQWLEEAESRTRRAETLAAEAAREAEELRLKLAGRDQEAEGPTPESLASFGQRISSILADAVQAADELLQEARAEAHQQREAVGAERTRIVEEARDEARRILEEARREEETARNRIAELERQRTAAVEELGAIRSRLGAFLEGPEPDSAGESPGSHIPGAPETP